MAILQEIYDIVVSKGVLALADADATY